MLHGTRLIAQRTTTPFVEHTVDGVSVGFETKVKSKEETAFYKGD